MSTNLTRRGFLGASIAGASLGAIGLAGCTGTSGSPEAAGTDGPTSNKLRLFTYEGDTTIDLLKAQVKKFDDQQGTVTTVDSLPGSGAAIYPDKLRTELLGGAGPDVWRIWGGQIGAPYVKAKQAMDLSKYYEKYAWADSIDNNAIDGMTFYDVKAGVPTTIFSMAGWYNKTLFEKAKITSIPTSYADMEAMNDQLVGAGITPCALGGKYGWDIMRLFEYLLECTAGPDLHDKLLLGQESWDRAEVVEAFKRFKKWQDKKWLPKGALGLDPSDVIPWYVQGKAAYTLNGGSTEASDIQAAKVDESNYGVFRLPTDHTPVRHSGFVEGYMINAHSHNPDKAAALIDFLVQVDSQKAMKRTASTVKGAGPDPEKYPLSAEWANSGGKDPFFVIQDQAFPKKTADQYFTVQSDLLQGSIDPATAAKKMQGYVSSWVNG